MNVRKVPILADMISATIVLAIFATLFQRGSTFVGDYVTTPGVNPINQLMNAFSPFVSSRNAGYDYIPSFLKWPSVPFYLLSAIVSSAFGNPEYSRLVIPVYLIIGSIGMSRLIRSLSLEHGLARDDRWISFLSSSCGLLYTLNPATLELLVRGFMATLATFAFLPLILISYHQLAKANSTRSLLLKSSVVSLLVFATVGYTYSFLMVVTLILSYEVVFSFRRLTRVSIVKIGGRLALVSMVGLVLELPALYMIATQSNSQYLGSFWSNYALMNAPANPLTVLTLTSASWGPSYYQQYFLWYDVSFSLAVLCLIAMDLLAILRSGLTRWSAFSAGLLIASTCLALGPKFPLNTAINSIFPFFPEAFEFLPLVAMSIALLTGVSLGPKMPRKNYRFRIPLPTFSRTSVSALLALVLATSAVPMAISIHSNFVAIDVPSYDQQAFAWLAQQGDSGRIVLVPPSYANKYTYDAFSYAGPVDYWTLAPPKPVIIDNGGSIGGAERVLPYALYTGNGRLLDFLLSALGVKYVVLRSDIVSTWDVPFYHSINSSYIESAFPYLLPVQTFGQLAIYQNAHYQGLFSAYSFPIIVQGNSSSLPLIGQELEPGAPILFASALTTSAFETIAKSYSSPLLLVCSPNCPRPTLSLENQTIIGALGSQDMQVIDGQSWKNVSMVSDDDSTMDLYFPHTLFQDDFLNTSYTRSNWPAISGAWKLGSGQIIAQSTSNLDYALSRSVSVPLNFMVESDVAVSSGYSAGIVLATNTSISNNSVSISLVPSWNGLLVSRNQNGTWTTWAFVQTTIPIEYNTRYNMIVSQLGNKLQVMLNGKLSLSLSEQTAVPNSVLGFAANTANAMFSNFKVSRLDLVNSTQTRYGNEGWYGDHSSEASLPPSKEIVVSVQGGNPTGLFLTNSSEDVVQMLNPQTIPLDYGNLSPLSWTFHFNHNSARTFLVARFVNLNGWRISSGTIVAAVYGYAIGIDTASNTSLSFDETYSYLADLSALVGILMLIASIAHTTSTLRNRSRSPTVRDRGL